MRSAQGGWGGMALIPANCRYDCLMSLTFSGLSKPYGQQPHLPSLFALPAPNPLVSSVSCVRFAQKHCVPRPPMPPPRNSYAAINTTHNLAVVISLRRSTMFCLERELLRRPNGHPLHASSHETRFQPTKGRRHELHVGKKQHRQKP